MELLGRTVEPREAFWGAVILLGVGWFFLLKGSDPLLASLAIPVELVATYALVRPNVQPPPGEDDADEDGTDDATH